MEELLHEPQLPVAADERRLEAERSHRSFPPGDHAERAEERQRLGLALELVDARVLVGDRRFRRALRRLADEHHPGLGDRLDARGRVDEVAGDCALLHTAGHHCRLAGEHAGARTQVCADLRAELGHRLDELEGRADSPLGVILLRDGPAPHGHDRVADELLDRAAVACDQAPAVFEVAGEEVAHLLRVARLGKRCEADEVGEEHRHEPTFGGCRRERRGRTRLDRATRRRRRDERRPTVSAEVLSRRVLRPAVRAGGGETIAAIATEPVGLRVHRAAARA